MKIIYTLQDIVKNNNSIFLAGPTYRIKGDIKVTKTTKFVNDNWIETINTESSEPIKTSWRLEAVKILKDLNFDGIIYLPEWARNS